MRLFFIIKVSNQKTKEKLSGNQSAQFVWTILVEINFTTILYSLKNQIFILTFIINEYNIIINIKRINRSVEM